MESSGAKPGISRMDALNMLKSQSVWPPGTLTDTVSAIIRDGAKSVSVCGIRGWSAFD